MNPEKPIDPEITKAQTERPETPEEMAELWATLSVPEMILVKSILYNQPSQQDFYIKNSAPPASLGDFLDVSIKEETERLSMCITRGIGTRVDVNSKEPMVTIDDSNWRKLGPRGKWLSKWLPIAESLQSKIDAFKSKEK